MDSENESYLDYHDKFEKHLIDKFISNETDNIIDIYYDIQDRFPYFLNNSRFPDFMNFIIDNNFGLYNNNKKYNQAHIDYFIYDYNTEINTCLYLINKYLYYKKTSIDYTIFVEFAYNFTTT
jgi:hypothetical protein